MRSLLLVTDFCLFYYFVFVSKRGSSWIMFLLMVRNKRRWVVGRAVRVGIFNRESAVGLRFC